MDFIGLAFCLVVVILGLKECDKQELDHQLEMKKQEFRLDSLKNANGK